MLFELIYLKTNFALTNSEKHREITLENTMHFDNITQDKLNLLFCCGQVK